MVVCQSVKHLLQDKKQSVCVVNIWVKMLSYEYDLWLRFEAAIYVFFGGIDTNNPMHLSTCDLLSVLIM